MVKSTTKPGIVKRRPVTQADLIGAELRRRGWKVVELARHLGISRPACSNILLGKRHPPARQRQIAELFGMDPLSLWGGYLAPELRKGVA